MRIERRGAVPCLRTAHAPARFVEARRRRRVRAIQPRIVTQLTRLGDTGVIRLPCFAVLRTLMPFQERLAVAAERHDGRALAIQDLGCELYEPGLSKVF